MIGTRATQADSSGENNVALALYGYLASQLMNNAKSIYFSNLN